MKRSRSVHGHEKFKSRPAVRVSISRINPSRSKSIGGTKLTGSESLHSATFIFIRAPSNFFAGVYRTCDRDPGAFKSRRALSESSFPLHMSSVILRDPEHFTSHNTHFIHLQLWPWHLPSELAPTPQLLPHSLKRSMLLPTKSCVSWSIKSAE